MSDRDLLIGKALHSMVLGSGEAPSAGDASKLPLISDARMVPLAGHDKVMVWCRGGYSGDLLVWSGDGQAVVERLMAPEVERIVDAMHAAVTHMRTETIEEVIEIVLAYLDYVEPSEAHDLLGKLEALKPPPEDQPIQYCLTEKGKVAT